MCLVPPLLRHRAGKAGVASVRERRLAAASEHGRARLWSLEISRSCLRGFQRDRGSAVVPGALAAIPATRARLSSASAPQDRHPSSGDDACGWPPTERLSLAWVWGDEPVWPRGGALTDRQLDWRRRRGFLDHLAQVVRVFFDYPSCSSRRDCSRRCASSPRFGCAWGVAACCEP